MNQSEDYIKLFEINTDASNSIRGIYYQFLVTLDKWVENFIEKRNTVISVEIEDDIRGISDEIVFTQKNPTAVTLVLIQRKLRKVY